MLVNKIFIQTFRVKHFRLYYDCCFAVQLLSHVWLFVTPYTTTCQVSLSFTISQSFLKLMCTESMMPSNHFILCHSLHFLPSIFLSIRSFSNVPVLHIRSKYWSFSFSISPSLNIQCWFFESLLQHHSLKVSVIQCSAFLMGQLSHLYMTTGKTIALTI